MEIPSPTRKRPNAPVPASNLQFSLNQIPVTVSGLISPQFNQQNKLRK